MIFLNNNATLVNRLLEVKEYINQSSFLNQIAPDYIRAGVKLYPDKGGKMLRPAILLLACELVGGDTKSALPAAAAIEISHIWTLVHDDIIDKDNLRRGGPSVHAYYADQFGEINQDLAMLVGDVQQAWAFNLINELSNEISISVKNYAISELSIWAATVLEGEVLDMEYSQTEIEELTEEMILDMLFKKTASTFRMASRIGSMIGLNKVEPENELVVALENICINAGIAFQLKDDLLGIIGDETKLGKPIGSDIREGKRTIALIHAYFKANLDQREFIKSVLGREDITIDQIEEFRSLLKELGSLDYLEELADQYINKAIHSLEILPESAAKISLNEWISTITKRSS